MSLQITRKKKDKEGLSDINTTQRKNVFFLSLVQPLKCRKEKKVLEMKPGDSPLNDIWGQGVLANVPSGEVY